MSPGNTTRLKADSSKIILRSADSTSVPGFELPVEIVVDDESEPIIRAPLAVGEDTRVTLVANDYMVNGIVRFCRADRNSYLITIVTQHASGERSDTGYFRDPGTLAVDDFLTEEEEAKILESLEGSSRSLPGDSGISSVFRLGTASFCFAQCLFFHCIPAARNVFRIPAHPCMA